MTFGLGKIEYSELFDVLREVGAGLPNGGQLVNLVKLPSDAILGNSVNFETILGADSLDTVELVMALEEEFETEIPDEEAEKITTVQLAIDYINTNLA